MKFEVSHQASVPEELKFFIGPIYSSRFRRKVVCLSYPSIIYLLPYTIPPFLSLNIIQGLRYKYIFWFGKIISMVYFFWENIVRISFMPKAKDKSHEPWHNTRQSAWKDLEVPSGTHKVLFENSFRYCAVNEWNNIKPYIRNCVSLKVLNCLISKTILIVLKYFYYIFNVSFYLLLVVLKWFYVF